MKSKEGDKYLGKHLNSINDLLEEGHDPKVRDLVVYEDAKYYLIFLILRVMMLGCRMKEIRKIMKYGWSSYSRKSL